MKDTIEELLRKIESKWNKRQGWLWRVRNKLIYNFTRNLYVKGMPKFIADPSIDKDDEPFSFYAKPSMQLGVPGDDQATRVDQDGQLDTRSGQFIFLVGNPIEPVKKRIWSLTKGYLPEINYEIMKKDVKLSFRAFQFWIDESKDKKTPINFIQVDIENCLEKDNDVSVYFGCFFSEFKVKTIMIKRPRFNKNWSYYFENGLNACRGDKLLYIGDKEQKPTKLYSKLSKDKGINNYKLTPYSKKFKGNKLKVKKDTITLIQEHELKLKPKESTTLVFKVPHYPINIKDTKLIKRLSEVRIEDIREEFIRFWEEILEKCTQISVIEEKVVNTHKASLIFNFMCQNYHPEGTLEQHVNRFQYNEFWLRDSSFYSRMYAIFNRPDIARRLLLFFLTKQDKDGNFCSQSGQLDGWGQTLWAFGEYIKYTRDEEFANIIFNPLMKAIGYLKKVVDDDNWGILPPRFAADNEMISGRYTGHNFWAWIGLNNAIYIADFLNKEPEKKIIQDFRKRFLNNFIPILNKVSEKHDNRIPPGLDTDIGEDWSNLLMIYPQKLLDLNDPKIKTTLKAYRENKMPEGIAMWMVFLHHYITERIAQQHLLLDEQELVLRDLYSMLSHTGACHGGFEHNIKPWGDRHYLIPIRVLFLKLDYFNYPPHGWFAVAYNLLLRNMLIREEDDDLHLISALSPEWTQGDLEIINANTYFGKCNLTLMVQGDSETKKLIFTSQFERNMPKNIIIHFPYWVNKELMEIISNHDYELDENKTKIVIKPEKKILMTFHWPINYNLDLSYMSYKKAVNWLRSEYKKRFQTQGIK